MDKVIIVLFEASISFVLFYLVFFFWLRKQTFFTANRFYLLSTAVFSLIIPLLQFSFPTKTGNEVVVYNLLESITVSAEGYEQGIVKSISGWEWISGVYFTGVLFSLALLLFKISKILMLEKKIIRAKSNGHQKNVVFVDAHIYPFSFLNKVYINPKKYTPQELDKIIAHEIVHINQQHTWDCLFYELLIVFFWFHPVVYQYRTSAKVLHEYLADEGAIRSGVSPMSYQTLLFEKATGLSTVALANSFNYSLVKRRLIMLTKNKSSKWTKIRLLYFLPTVIALVVLFACNKNDSDDTINAAINEDKVSVLDGNKKVTNIMDPSTGDVTTIKDKEGNIVDEKVYFIVDKMPEYPGGEDALRKFIATNVMYPKKAKETGTEGKIYVQFIVNKNGKVEQVKHIATRAPVKEKNEIGEIVVVAYTEVFHREGKAFDELAAEGERVVSGLPDWTPGEHKGEPVNVSFTVPINFALQ